MVSENSLEAKYIFMSCNGFFKVFLPNLKVFPILSLLFIVRVHLLSGKVIVKLTGKENMLLHTIKNREKQAGQGTWAVIAAIALVAIIGFGIYAYNSGEDGINPLTSPSPTVTSMVSPTDDPDAMASPDAMTAQPTISEIKDNPNAYIGQTVTVEGDVEDIRSPQVFRLDQEGTVLGDEILVVMNTGSLPSPSPDNNFDLFEDTDVVRVTGQVRQLITAEIEREFDLDFDTEIEAEFEGELIIVAREVRRIDQ